MSTHTHEDSKAAKVNVPDGFDPEQVKNLSSVLNAILADAFEAILGAVYLDAGWNAAEQLVLRELSVSCELGGAALIVTIGLGMTFGVLAAIRQNTWVDYLLTTLAVVGYTVPSFVIAGLGIMIFANFLGSVTGGAIAYSPVWTGTYGTIGELWLPALSIGLYTSGQITRITRASMLEVIQQDYIRTARAKGLREWVVTLRHALRNALVPVISILGTTVVGILVGVLVIENIFGIPGLGKEFVESILQHDYNVTVGVFTIFALLIGLSNLAVDLIYTVVDPRIRY